MPSIHISAETFMQLQGLGEVLIDTPETVIRRLIRDHRAKPNGKPRGWPVPQQGRVKKGEKTRNEAFYDPIIKVLRDAGGRLATAEAVDRVGELMPERLSHIDRQPLRTGEIRWRNTVRFARHDLVTLGKLNDNSGFGFWELAKRDQANAPGGRKSRRGFSAPRIAHPRPQNI